MRTTIDKAGRVVIPRTLRERIGLAEGGKVDIQLEGAGVRIEAVAGGELREKDGLLFIPRTGAPVDHAFIREMIDGDRQRA